MGNSDRPVHEIKLARICASIWANHGTRGGVWYSVSVSRVYQDGEAWKKTGSFGRDDLPLVSKAAELAYSWIWKEAKLERQRRDGRSDT